MSKSRIKIQLPVIHTRDEAEAVMNELALAENNRRKLIARRDAEVLAINAKYESGLAECAEAVKEKSEMLRAWAEATPEAFPKNRKSLDLVSGLIGFRTGTPKLALISRAWNWEKVLAAIKVRAFNFTRATEEVDKESVLAFYSTASDKPEVEAKVLAPIGVKVVQDESFYVEPNLTDLESRQTVEAK